MVSRFISAKDDNQNKPMVWAVVTDDSDVMHLALRDFRPHVTAPTLSPNPTATPMPTATPATLAGKILFKTDRGGQTELYIMNPDGSQQQPLPRDQWALYTQLQNDMPNAPDGARTVAVRGAGQRDLVLVDLTTGQELRITSTGVDEYDAAWSPVDNRIAYVSEETGRGDIYVLNLDGSANLRSAGLNQSGFPL